MAAGNPSPIMATRVPAASSTTTHPGSPSFVAATPGAEPGSEPPSAKGADDHTESPVTTTAAAS